MTTDAQMYERIKALVETVERVHVGCKDSEFCSCGYLRPLVAITQDVKEIAAFAVEQYEAREWRPIESAPRDGTPIIALCCHDADPYFVSARRLTAYGSHCEAVSHVEDGIHIIHWAEGGQDTGEYGEVLASWAAWWFKADDEEVTANPTHWMPLPPAPTTATPDMGQEG